MTNKNLVEAKRNDNTQLVNQYKGEILQLSQREKELRDEAKLIIKQYDADQETNDKDYVFIGFILRHLPQGLVGLLLAVIFFAAMSSTSSELNALAATTTVDIYKRNFKKSGSESHYVVASKFWTLFWGLVAILFASIGTLFENLIQFVNIIGSIFYGVILGIFLVAFYFKKIGANAVFIAGVLVEIVVIAIFKADIIPYLWLNVIGALGLILVATIIQLIIGNKKRDEPMSIPS
jgi:Na+/proline symporter